MQKFPFTDIRTARKMTEDPLPLFEIQYLKPETIIIGLTGPLTSGCSTVAEYLKEEKGYTLRRLSDIIAVR